MQVSNYECVIYRSIVLTFYVIDELFHDLFPFRISSSNVKKRGNNLHRWNQKFQLSFMIYVLYFNVEHLTVSDWISKF